MYFHYLIRLFKDLFKAKSWRTFSLHHTPVPVGKKKKKVYLKFTLELVFVFKGTHEVKPQWNTEFLLFWFFCLIHMILLSPCVHNSY